MCFCLCSVNIYVWIVILNYHQSKYGFVMSHTIYSVILYLTVNLRKKHSKLFFCSLNLIFLSANNVVFIRIITLMNEYLNKTNKLLTRLIDLLTFFICIKHLFIIHLRKWIWRAPILSELTPWKYNGVNLFRPRNLYTWNNDFFRINYILKPWTRFFSIQNINKFSWN